MASNHEILTAVGIASAMPVESLIRATSWRIPGLYRASVAAAVLRIARPKLAAASDEDLTRWMEEVESDFCEALSAELEYLSNPDCNRDFDGLLIEGENRMEPASVWLEPLLEALTAACVARGLIHEDPAPAPVAQPVIPTDEALIPF